MSCLKPSLITAGTVLIAAVSATVPVIAADPIGNATVVVRDVSGTVDATQRVLAVADQVHRNELLITQSDSTAGLTFLDETTLMMGAKARLVLDDLVYNGGTSPDSMIITLTAGTFHFVSGQIAKDKVSILTPTVAIGIRGTDFYVSVAPGDGETDVTVVDGEVTVEPRGEAGGGTSVSTGQSVNSGNLGTVSATPAPSLQAAVAEMNTTAMTATAPASIASSATLGKLSAAKSAASDARASSSADTGHGSGTHY